MSNEEINRKIAEVCGWTNTKRAWPETWYGTPPNKGGGIRAALPDYCSDLNAMREAEKTTFKTERELREYVYVLVSLMQKGEFTVCATAHQRALAFLKTVAPKL